MPMLAATKRLVKIAGGIGVIAGAVTATAAAWVIVEPYWIAHRAWVRGQNAVLDAKIATAVAPALVGVNEIKLDASWTRQQAIDDTIARWELNLEKATDDVEKLRIRSQINSLNRERADLSSKIDSLNRTLGR